MDLCFVSIFAVAAESTIASVAEGTFGEYMYRRVGMLACAALWFLVNIHFVYCWWRMHRFAARVLGKPVPGPKASRGKDGLLSKFEEETRVRRRCH